MKKYDPELDHCPLCNSRKISEFHRDFRGNAIFKCESCNIQFMNPQYTNEYLEDYYKGYIDHDSDAKEEPAAAAYKLYLNAFSKFCTTAGKMLDYGCGAGRFMDASIKAGWDVSGYDVDCDGTHRVEEKTGVKVWCGDPMEMVRNCNGKFDVVSMHQVLEHIKNPSEVMDNIVSMIKPDGYLMISVPNICSLSSRLKNFLERKGMRKNRLGAHYSTDHHLFYYCPETLRIFLASKGFRILWKRNGHKAEIGESNLSRFIKRNIIEHLYQNSTFIVVAKKMS